MKRSQEMTNALIGKTDSRTRHHHGGALLEGYHSEHSCKPIFSIRRDE